MSRPADPSGDTPPQLLPRHNKPAFAQGPGKLALLPEEILLMIFPRVAHPASKRLHQPTDVEWIDYGESADYADDNSYIEDDEEVNIIAGACKPFADMFHLVLTCRRFHRLFATPLQEYFPDWCHKICRVEGRTYEQNWAPCLRAILRHPILATYVKHLQLDMSSLDSDSEGISDWTPADIVLAEKVLAAVPNHFDENILDPSTYVTSSSVWMSFIKEGRKDAILALLVLLTEGLEEITLSSFERLVEMDEFDIGSELSCLHLLFRGAINSQMLAKKGEACKNKYSTLLPALRRITIRTRKPDTGDERNRIRSLDALPFLALPSLGRASLSLLDEVDPDDEEEGFPKLWLKSLHLNYRRGSVLQTGCLVRCCPLLEEFSYFHQMEEDARDGSPDLLSHLATIVPQLKSLTLCEGLVDGFENLHLFHQLKSISFDWRRYTHLTSFHWGQHSDYIRSDGRSFGALWDIMPLTLERLDIWRVLPIDLPCIMEALGTLPAAKRDGLVPNLTTLTIALPVGKDEHYEDIAQDFGEACMNLPVHVEQNFQEPACCKVDLRGVDWESNSTWSYRPRCAVRVEGELAIPVKGYNIRRSHHLLPRWY